jgi:phosphoglycerol transferase MdoB-like AlkP superfamily enzyme
MYSFGTHVSFDSTGFSYGDGNDAVLNRFYNLDRQFGTFIEAFKQSDLAQDTIIVFTTDHCTYADQDYAKAFPDYHRECTDVDVIPLFVYYDGIEAEKVDVNGKNSLCLTPTILDYLDINQENYFLGTSLFDDNANSDFDTMFYDASYLVSTKDGEVRYLSDMEIDSFLSKVLAYYTAVEAQP